MLVSLDAARLDLARRYRPDQPRDEMGKRVFDGGPRRRPGAGGAGSSGDSNLVIAAGGFTPEQLDMSVQLFVSAFCKGDINRVLPGQFRDWKVGEVERLANSGDASARTCMKLLGRQRYRK